MEEADEGEEVEGSASLLRCSFAADARGDPLFATAAPAAGFLLVEQPGAWGRQALTESQLDAAVAAELGARAVDASLRVVLIRRHGRNPRPAQRSWAVVDSTPGRESSKWGSFSADTELLDIPLDGSAGEASADPCYLVCTHGRHDACCALRGRPVAAAFAREQPLATWECSHVGGDRFAPNVVVLPHGLYYGRVSAAAASSIIAAHERSEVVVDLLRGRTAFRPAVQAAQYFARRHLDSTAIDDLSPIGETTDPAGGIVVRLAACNATVTVTVRPSVGELAGLLTCRATHAVHPPTFALAGIDVSSG